MINLDLILSDLSLKKSELDRILEIELFNNSPMNLNHIDRQYL